MLSMFEKNVTNSLKIQWSERGECLRTFLSMSNKRGHFYCGLGKYVQFFMLTYTSDQAANQEVKFSYPISS